MRTEFVRIYKAVHTWTGIIAGMALFIAFYAGALTVFKEPLARWATPPAAMPAVALEDTPQLIARVLAADPMAARDFSIHLADDEQVPGRMGWQVRDPDADEHDETSVRHYAATLDPDGQARIDSVHPSQLASFIDVLHRVVGLPVDCDPNRWVMGVVAALYGNQRLLLCRHWRIGSRIRILPQSEMRQNWASSLSLNVRTGKLCGNRWTSFV